MTDERLVEIRKRLDELPSADWSLDPDVIHAVWSEEQGAWVADCGDSDDPGATARFIAYCPGDIRDLLAEVKTLKDIISGMQQDPEAYKLGVADGKRQGIEGYVRGLPG